jgi:hypothetical protein
VCIESEQIRVRNCDYSVSCSRGDPCLDGPAPREGGTSRCDVAENCQTLSGKLRKEYVKLFMIVPNPNRRTEVRIKLCSNRVSNKLIILG